jgi:hypothetical protein
MTNFNKWVLNLSVILGITWFSFSWVFGASQEIRPPSQMSGTIVSPLEERKQALSSGDKIFVALDLSRPVRKGDTLEIFQPSDAIIDGKPAILFAKAGEVVILEVINDYLLLGIIESSSREIAIGDRIYLPE